MYRYRYCEAPYRRYRECCVRCGCYDCRCDRERCGRCGYSDCRCGYCWKCGESECGCDGYRRRKLRIKVKAEEGASLSVASLNLETKYIGKDVDVAPPEFIVTGGVTAPSASVAHTEHKVKIDILVKKGTPPGTYIALLYEAGSAKDKKPLTSLGIIVR